MFANNVTANLPIYQGSSHIYSYSIVYSISIVEMIDVVLPLS